MPIDPNLNDRKTQEVVALASHVSGLPQNQDSNTIRSAKGMPSIKHGGEAVKMIMLIKRKPGLTIEEFKQHYEAYHSKLGQKFFGHLMISYKRNYIAEARHGIGPATRTIEWDYDCITEFIYPSIDARMEVVRLNKIPEIALELKEDEEKFADGQATIMIRCDTLDTGTGDGCGSLPFR